MLHRSQYSIWLVGSVQPLRHSPPTSGLVFNAEEPVHNSLETNLTNRLILLGGGGGSLRRHVGGGSRHPHPRPGLAIR
jgi:hypothetical protein